MLCLTYSNILYIHPQWCRSTKRVLVLQEQAFCWDYCYWLKFTCYQCTSQSPRVSSSLMFVLYFFNFGALLRFIQVCTSASGSGFWSWLSWEHSSGPRSVCSLVLSFFVEGEPHCVKWVQIWIAMDLTFIRNVWGSTFPGDVHTRSPLHPPPCLRRSATPTATASQKKISNAFHWLGVAERQLQMLLLFCSRC